jgi:hypothetical protein
METLEHEAAEADRDIREGNFQRWLAMGAGLSSLVSGAEVTYEHYKGSYSGRIMYTPLVMSAALFGAGVGGFYSKRIATKVLPAVSILTLADCVTGFVFHVRGIQRKPGGWRLPVVNIVMGPPLFAPLLFGISAYLGLIASFLQRGDEGKERGLPAAGSRSHWAIALGGSHEKIGFEQDVREGRFQQHLIAASLISISLSAFEAAYSHYKNNFRYSVQWSPLVVASVMVGVGMLAMKRPKVAHTAFPLVCAVAIANGTVGFGYHLRGTLRRPGGLKKLGYNIIYGPPLFAPLLFAASGTMGVLASLLRRER